MTFKMNTTANNRRSIIKNSIVIFIEKYKILFLITVFSLFSFITFIILDSYIIELKESIWFQGAGFVLSNLCIIAPCIIWLHWSFKNFFISSMIALVASLIIAYFNIQFIFLSLAIFTENFTLALSIVLLTLLGLVLYFTVSAVCIVTYLMIKAIKKACFLIFRNLKKDS